MNEKIFREKSLDKVKSPEDLDDYIRVSNPGVWLLLVSIIVLLAGACVWGIFGHIDSIIETRVHAESGALVCYISDEDIPSVEKGMTVKFKDFEATVTDVGKEEERGYPCALDADQEIPDGIYEGRIVLKSFKPLSFVLN